MKQQICSLRAVAVTEKTVGPIGAKRGIAAGLRGSAEPRRR